MLINNISSLKTEESTSFMLSYGVHRRVVGFVFFILHFKKKLDALYSSPNIIRVIK